MNLRQDVRLALRRLARDRAFTIVAVLTLALGIGASTAIFTVVDAVLLRPLPFPDPQALTMLRPSSGSRLSAAYLYEWREGRRMFADLAGWRDGRATLSGRGDPLEVLVDRTTTNFFSVLGAQPQLGKTFTATPDLARVQPEVVLSHGLWQRVFDSDPAVVGRPITVDDAVYTIVGVMPAGFTVRTTELAESRAEMWMPLPLEPGDRTGMGGVLNVVGRLSPGATLEQARTELSLVSDRIEAQFPSYSRDWTLDVVPLLDATVRDVRPALLVLFGGVGILLLIACVNVANLALGRAAARRAELAIRVSLGARPGRLVRQLLTESLVLASIGGALGLLLAISGTTLLVASLPAGLALPRTGEIAVDLRVFAFGGFVTLLTALLFGVVPAVTSVRSAGSTSTAVPRHRVGSVLIVVEVALAVLLLAGAGLLARSFQELTRVAPGVDAEQVLTLRITLPESRYTADDRIRAFSGALLERIEGVPGVSAAGVANYLPLSNFGMANRFEIDGRPDSGVTDQKFAWVAIVGGRYFDAMRIPLVRGRVPGSADTERTPPVFVIDEALARRHWPGRDPVGAHLTWHVGQEQTMSGEIIGVVGSVRWQAMAVDPPGSAYWWHPQTPGRELTVVARTRGEPAAIAGLVAAEVRAIDPNQPVGEIRAMSDFVAADLARPRFTMLLLGGFATAALLLAAIGLYGVMAFAVVQRTREIGVRVALGAQRGDVLRLILRYGVRLLGAGLVIGIVAALAMGRAVAGLLYGITPRDPQALMAVTLALAAVGIIAALVPARRAMRLDTVIALRHE